MASSPWTAPGGKDTEAFTCTRMCREKADALRMNHGMFSETIGRVHVSDTDRPSGGMQKSFLRDPMPLHAHARIVQAIDSREGQQSQAVALFVRPLCFYDGQLMPTIRAQERTTLPMSVAPWRTLHKDVSSAFGFWRVRTPRE